MPIKHIALSIDIDRYADNYIKKNCDGIIKKEGRPVPWNELRALCAEYRAKGFTVFPPCDHTDARGNCLGHDCDQ